ncbi:MAG: TRAP transporter small permease [Lachnospiraceae bacterium]|nr:TRAP transporter small permease [Lachnospiraceae bacterium]
MYQFLKKAMYNVSALLFGIALAIAFVAVIFRYVFNNSLYWSEEIVRYLFIWMFFFAVGDATRTGSHVALDLLPGRLHGTAKKILDLLIEVLSLVFDVVLIYYGAKLASINMTQYSPALRIPYGIIYAAIPFGGVMMAIFNVLRIVDMARGKEREVE